MRRGWPKKHPRLGSCQRGGTTSLSGPRSRWGSPPFRRSPCSPSRRGAPPQRARSTVTPIIRGRGHRMDVLAHPPGGVAARIMWPGLPRSCCAWEMQKVDVRRRNGSGMGDGGGTVGGADAACTRAVAAHHNQSRPAAVGHFGGAGDAPVGPTDPRAGTHKCVSRPTGSPELGPGARDRPPPESLSTELRTGHRIGVGRKVPYCHLPSLVRYDQSQEWARVIYSLGNGP